MILCITPNPAVDRTITLPSLVPGTVHRARNVMVAAGGKGLNVARTIRVLGGKTLCMGFVGGHSGRLLADLARDEGMAASWTWTNVETRICTILIAQDGDATVINEPGMPVSAFDWQRLQEDVNKQMDSASTICISGSLPPQSPDENWREVLDMLVAAGRQVWVDTSGASLHAALARPGICIKVNGNEIGEALGFEIKDMASAQRAFTALSQRGMVASVITLGAEGALLASRDGRWLAQGPRVHVVSTVGSGDSFLGGLVSALDVGRDWHEALRDAVAAGTANTLSAGAGRFTREEFNTVRSQVQVRTW